MTKPVILTEDLGGGLLVEGEQSVVIVQSTEMGPVGGGSATYLHNQSTPATTWTINHNLGFIPDITLYSVGGMVFEADILHTSSNQALIYLTAPFAGTARCE